MTWILYKALHQPLANLNGYNLRPGNVIFSAFFLKMSLWENVFMTP